MFVRQRHDGAHVGRGIGLLAGEVPREQRVDLGFGHAAALAAIVVAQLCLIPELALAGRVIHQRHQPHAGPADQFPGFLNHIRHRDFAAQMQEVIGAQEIGLTRGRNRGGEDAGAAVDIFRAVLAPDTKQIQHGCDAAGGELAVTGHHGGGCVPKYFWPRHVMRLEMIGVQLDQARQDQVATGVVATGRRLAFAEFGDATIGEGDPALFDHAVGENEASVAQNGFRRRSHFSLPQAAAAKAVTSTMRSVRRSALVPRRPADCRARNSRCPSRRTSGYPDRRRRSHQDRSYQPRTAQGALERSTKARSEK